MSPLSGALLLATIAVLLPGLVMADLPQMPEFVKQANRSTWGAFFYAGMLFVVAAVTGVFSFKSDLTVVNQQLIIPLFILGAALIGYTAYREWQTNHPPPPPPPGPTLPNPEDYKVEVAEPKFGDQLSPGDGNIILTGKVKKDPTLDGYKLWYLMSGTGKFWPTHVFIGPDKKWKIDYNPGNFNDGDRRLFRFCVVGKNGMRLFKAYREINEALKTPGRGYEPLRELTDDVVKCVDHAIFLKKAPPVA
jgi:hypothetical protein